MAKTRPVLAALAGAVSLGLVLSACSSDGSGGTKDDVKIAFVPGIASDPFFRAMEIAAKDEAKKLGIELTWQGASDEYSPESQLPFVDSALTQGVDALVLVPTDADALQPSVDKAASMDIPVVTVDTTVSDTSSLVSHITGDNHDGGERAAEEMSSQLDGDGKVLVISASPTNTTGTQRVEGFQDAVDSAYEGLNVLPVQYAYSEPAKATTILNTTLLEHSDLEGVFAVDGTSCTGAAAALRSAKATDEVNLICYDAYSNQVQDLEEGVVSALIAQDPAKEARLALQYAYAQVTGEGKEDIEREVVIPNIVINRDNLGETKKYQYAE